MEPVTVSWMMRMLGASLLVLTLLSTTSCASVGTAVAWTPCVHPEIDPSTDQGVQRGLLAYQEEIDTCNAMNGTSTE
jgi:hypothetical protein